MRALGRTIAVVTAATLAIMGLAAVPAAAQAVVEVTPVTWAYVDSAAPHQRFVQPASDMPVGTFVDTAGVSHVDRSYVTFDLSSLKASDVLQSTLFTNETSGTDCTRQRQTQVWLTATATEPTWDDQPPEQTQLNGGSIGQCPTQVGYSATTVLHDAVAAGRRKVTFEFRIAAAAESDPSVARHYDPKVTIGVIDNRAPERPTQLTVNQTACSYHPVPIGVGDNTLIATITDPDDVSVSAEWAWWPVDHPDQRTDVVESFGAVSGHPTRLTLAQRQLTDATTYAWQVRGIDQNDTGPWSAVCEFTTIFTPPAAAPTVTSTDYPTTGFNGGTGVPGTFTFNANGDRHVVGFDFGADGVIPVGTVIPADHPGGTATVHITPTHSGPNRLAVVGVDAAGNLSPTGTYDFLVAPNSPKMTCTPAEAFIGTPRTCVFTPTGAGTVVSYSYSLNNGPATTVPADQNGSASVTVTPSDPNAFGFSLSVTGTLSTGGHTDSAFAFLQTDLGTPTVTQSPDNPIVGQPTQFTFTPGMPGVVSYTYTWEGAQATVPAAADGAATVTLSSPDQFAELDVFSTTSGGVSSGTAQDFVSFQSNQPTVASTQYPENTFGGGVTEPGTFVFSAPVPGVVSYTYSIDNGTPTTVAAGSDGTAGVVYTPLTINTHTLSVTATYGDGSLSQPTQYSFLVNSVAPRVSCDTNPTPTVGSQVPCTFTPVQPGAVSYVYSVNGGAEVPVAANPDGTGSATITIPAIQALELPVSVWSVNGAGLRSDPAMIGIPFTTPQAAHAS